MLRLKLIHVSSSGSSNFVSSRLQQYNAVSIWVMLLPPLYHQQYVSIWAMLLPPLYHHCTSFGRPLASVERSLWRPLCLHSATTATLEPPWQWLCLHAAFCTRLVPLCTAVFGDSRKAHGSCCSCERQKCSGGRFKNAYELLNLRALTISMLYKNHIFQCMGKIFCVEFQRVPLKFHTKYLTHTMKNVNFIRRWKLKSS